MPLFYIFLKFKQSKFKQSADGLYNNEVIAKNVKHTFIIHDFLGINDGSGQIFPHHTSILHRN